MLSTLRSGKEIGSARRVDLGAHREPTVEDVRELIGMPIVIEGGIAQGKSSLSRALVAYFTKLGIPAKNYPEPTDEAALADFMTYQKPLPDAASDAEKESFRVGRIRAAVRLQKSMMERRTQHMRDAAEFSRGGIAVVDRGPFGDTTFATSTYRAYGVPTAEENSYFIKFLSNYLHIKFMYGTFLILRVDAPVSKVQEIFYFLDRFSHQKKTYERYLARRYVDARNNKYTPEYLQGIEDAHDACAESWGSYVVYDNSNVPYHRPQSPVDENGNTLHGSPDISAIMNVVRELCELSREMKKCN
jgi:deoxyadenosine/deoxycytidine kinase